MPSLKELSTDELRVAGDAIETMIDFRDYLPPGGMLLAEMGKHRDDIRDLLEMTPLERVSRDPCRKTYDGLEDADLGRLSEAVFILIRKFPGHMESPESIRRLVDVLIGIVLEKRVRACAKVTVS